MLRTHLLVVTAVFAVACASETAGPKPLPGERNEALRAASARYRVPLDLLMAMAYHRGHFESPTSGQAPTPPAHGRWSLRQDVTVAEGPLSAEDLHPPRTDPLHDEHPAFGLMHLDAESLQRGAMLIGRSPEDVAASNALNIEATAALLRAGARDSSEEALISSALELWGVSVSEDASRLARETWAEWRRYGFDVTTEDGERIVLMGKEERPNVLRQGLAAGEYPPMEKLPALSFKYGVGRGGEVVRYIVIHDMEELLDDCIVAFTKSDRVASAHYGMSATGRLVQFVDESNNAYHCGHGYFNRSSVGIEHEGFAARENGGGYFSKQYLLSAQLVCAIAKKHNVPVDRAHIFGHGNVPSNINSRTLCSDDRAYVNTNGTCGGASNHTDPGRYWDWDTFLGLVAKCVGGTPLDPVDAGTPEVDAGVMVMDAGTMEPIPELPVTPVVEPSIPPADKLPTLQEPAAASGCSASGLSPALVLLALLGTAARRRKARRSEF